MPELSFFETRLNDICGEENVSRNVLMSEHTTFRTGGPADYFVTPDDREMFRKLLWYLRESGREHLILGKGSNILVGDKGYRGCVIDTSAKLKNIVIEGEYITADAGATLAMIASKAAEEGLKGMEFASGIPGSLGGAVYMNAGAYGGEMAQIVESVEALSPSGEIITIANAEMDFAYRSSVVQKEGFPVLSARLKLSEGDRDEIKARMKELNEMRRSKQPLEYPSAGSTFKRPEGYYAGKLIMDTGLSGMTIGGARVSPKHNGFIVNIGKATSADILDLIYEVQERVKAKFGVSLEPEVRIIGEF